MTDFTVSKAFAFEACGLIYRKWSEAFDNLKAEQNAKDDGTPDWDEFHQHRLEAAKKEEARLKSLVDEAAPINHKIVMGE